DGDLVSPLELADRALGHQEGPLLHGEGGAHPAELPRTQDVPRIGKRRCDPDRAGRRIDLAIGEDELPGMGIDGPVVEDELERRVAVGERPRRGLAVDAADKAKVFALADGDVSLDGIETRHRGEERRRADEIADLPAGDAGDAVGEGAYL